MQPFVVNRSNDIVFPSNFLPELDLSVIDSLDQLDRVIRRDFEIKAPTGADIRNRVESDYYANRYELMRDVALNLFWAGRFALTLYRKQPTRWGDVPRRRRDVFMPTVVPWLNGDATAEAVQKAYIKLPAAWDDQAEDRIFQVIFDVFGHRKHHAIELAAIKPTVSQLLSDPTNLTYRLKNYDPDFPTFSYNNMIDCSEPAPELVALHRWAMVLHNQYPWDRAEAELIEVGQLADDDFVIALHPRDEEVRGFFRRLDSGGARASSSPAPLSAKDPVRPCPAVNVRTHFSVLPRLEALAVVHGDRPCTNEDIIRNAAYNWSPMTAEEISEKTGIEQRMYATSSLEQTALQAAQDALDHAGRGPEEIGAVIVCTCTSTRMIPSIATWITGQLGMQHTHGSYDLVAACAGMAYGLSDAVRVLQEVQRPVLLVCAEKFSDKIGNVRTSRMIFGDGAAAMVIGVAAEGEQTDIEYLQTYAGGPVSQVNSVLWPNPAFDNNITVFGPEVKAMAGRYLEQMIEELKELPDPDGQVNSLLDSIELIVPHQANKTMVTQLAIQAGLSLDNVYFNIAEVGNASAASIPLAIHDAVRDGVITEPVRIFAPGFGAGAVAGYAVMRIDPAVVATAHVSAAVDTLDPPIPPTLPEQSLDAVSLAFG